MDPNDLDEEMAVYDDKYEEVFQEGFKFKPLPEHVQESDEEDSDDVGIFQNGINLQNDVCRINF